MALGHTIVSKGPLGYVCARCGDTWTHNSRHAMLENGPCSGDYPWDIPESTLNTWRLPKVQKSIIYFGKKIHQSHTICYYRGIVYCMQCGYLTTGARVQHLKIRCRMRCLPSQRRILRGIRDGISPCAGGEWPLPEDDQCPQGLIPFQVKGEYCDMESFTFQRGRGPTGSMLF